MDPLADWGYKLHRLSLTSAGTGVRGDKLAKFIKGNPSLRFLDLSSTPLDLDGAVELSKGISGSGLEVLDLSRTNIGAKGAIALLKEIKGQNSLKTLKLDFVKLGATGAAALADFLHTSSISELSLASTGIPDDKWPILKAAFERTSTLRSVIVGNTEHKMRNARDALAVVHE